MPFQICVHLLCPPKPTHTFPNALTLPHILQHFNLRLRSPSYIILCPFSMPALWNAELLTAARSSPDLHGGSFAPPRPLQPTGRGKGAPGETNTTRFIERWASSGPHANTLRDIPKASWRILSLHQSRMDGFNRMIFCFYGDINCSGPWNTFWKPIISLWANISTEECPLFLLMCTPVCVCVCVCVWV